MPTKSSMLGELAERELLLPVLVNDALAANDRAKYLLTLLQHAFAWGRQPSGAPPRLRQERLAAGVEEPAFDDLVANSHAIGEDVWVPRGSELRDRLLHDLALMLAPLRTADADAARPLADRLDAIAARPLGELVSAADLDWLTAGVRGKGDSVHLLVMDLHQRLNALQASLATESVDGARAYGLDAEARAHVAAFMAGLNRTAALKFDHPGLGTTATRAGERLVIQNDIGTNDVHLLVVHVEGLEVRVTYSDLHAPRLAFFREALAPFDVAWASSGRREVAFAADEGSYELLTGSFTAGSVGELHRFLAHLGSRIVFLIDWNRARKRLRHFVGKGDAVALLRWAAAEEIGHMGFLRLGGEQAVYEALETTRVPLRAGERLDGLLGRERAMEFLRFVLRAASEGLRRGRSTFLVRDEIHAELAQYLRTAEQSTLTVAVEHACLIVELAAGVRDALELALAGDTAALARAGTRAQRWEHRADELVNQARALARRWPGAQPLQRLLTSSDDVADHLEEAAFLLTLPLGVVVPASAAALRALSEQVVRGAEEHLKALECAREMQQGRLREDLDDFLAAVDEVVQAEHAADEATRRAKVVILTESPDFRQLFLLSDVARRLEDAADQLMHIALTLRVQVLGEGDE
jgi:uncharacterized protein Yka (UPF0111/DUF47 family)